jgi:GTP-binding protein HflX
MLFATLDPTMRDVRLPGFNKAILSDTVGFVSDLPTQLIAAFRATLEEVASADLLVHVRDISHPDSDAQRDDVEGVLTQLGVGPEDEGAPPRIEAWNKMDLLAGNERQARLTEAARREDVVPISALTGLGLDELRERIADRLHRGAALHSIRVPVSDGSRIAWLHARGDVLGQETKGDHVHLEVRLSPENWSRFQSL